ncbi:hypothetical protein BFX06_14290 [Sulfobacillus thermosulfidooxidans]|nr:hypothetical protein BFX05_07185 [Sulfobacillus thermosulfidooxidans]OLZ17119.1 hypothetical protein BFX06_14290 [Sulfobacillus thermosulfidooxidans]OLZ20319.1 hypothetical protein BFX07_01020 [Sulfobacillus thermosulfidooxidans]
MPVESQQYRQTLGHFATGVTVVIAELEGSLHGMTANSFTSVSLHPPLILLAIDHKARMKNAMIPSRPLTISILKESQKVLSQLFAQPHPPSDPFDGLRLERARNGIPYLADSVAYLACHITQILPQGDHDVVFCQVEEFNILSEDGPLIFYQGHYHHLDGLIP